MNTDIPRPEYPRPQFQRSDWINLNGTWTYRFDPGCSGLPDSGGWQARQDNGQGLCTSTGFNDTISVPFAPESRLSGVGHTDFIEMMWYHRKIEVPTGWTERVILNFGGVDYESDIFIDGKLAGRHAGGQCAFEVDLTGLVEPGGTHDLVLCVQDYLRRGVQPAGKQCTSYKSRGCHYTRTTGIWQTVWLEHAAMTGLRQVSMVSDLDGGQLCVTPSYYTVATGNLLRVAVVADEQVVAEQQVAQANGVPVMMTIPDIRPWSPEDPFLYDIELQILDAQGAVLDTVSSYTGIRKVHAEGDRLFLNGKPLYQRLVLDQGFYPDGIWTAPSDEVLRHDIELSMAAGFNGARLHQKVFEPRFHYWADKLGYLTWGESCSWGIRCDDHEGGKNFLREWREIIERDRNHPSIITWTIVNETWQIADERVFSHFHAQAYDLTRALDPTRPVHGASGGAHVVTDIWSLHDYEQDPAKLAEVLAAGTNGALDRSQPRLPAAKFYGGQPRLLAEFGGIKWIPEESRTPDQNAWGYGNAPESTEEFHERLGGLVDTILAREDLQGYCYTQLTDVEQEQNGIYLYNRNPKFDMARIAAIFSRTPSWLHE